MQGCDVVQRARHVVRSLCKAQMALLIAAQSAERARIIAGVEAAIDAMLTAGVAAVIARFAGRRLLAAALPPEERQAALRRLAEEQFAEIARLSREFAGERRRSRRQALGAVASTQKAARQQLSTQLRRQRIVFAVAIRAMGGARTGPPAGSAHGGGTKVKAQRFRRSPKS